MKRKVKNLSDIVDERLKTMRLYLQPYDSSSELLSELNKTKIYKFYVCFERNGTHDYGDSNVVYMPFLIKDIIFKGEDIRFKCIHPYI